mgnify:CR=1 FL=1
MQKARNDAPAATKCPERHWNRHSSGPQPGNGGSSDAPAADRNVLGVINKVGLEVGKKVISMRRRIREFILGMAQAGNRGGRQSLPHDWRCWYRELLAPAS